MPNLTIQSRHRVHKDVRDVLTRVYWENKGEALAAIDAALQKHNMRLAHDKTDLSGEEGRVTFRILADPNYKYICDACTKEYENPAFDNVLVFGWYRMSSGRWEITGYVS